ncbi:MAG: hypothetical protein QM212_05035 [Bacteroidota bacterium]|jgi:hypothetical protein|nr:hypothetical protein [Bacteroidota bacterium]OQC46859.1 MAG: hypothetical protein BWX59_00128 [Bacteroidetes bacterium ADurb.Bin028]HNY43349.1 hypothetical protein [Bacteroidales bacterium]HOD88663.1 hypothetical protein [Bacteroidales bacterium]
MKKTILIILAIVLIAIGLSSCKGSEDCPAYGKANIETENTIA